MSQDAVLPLSKPEGVLVGNYVMFAWDEAAAPNSVYM